MSNATLTIEQVRQLVHQLASNDDFRGLFEENPAAALAKLNISQETISNLSSACLAPKRVGSKEVFQLANAKLDMVTAQRFAAFLVPTLNIGSPK